MIHRIAFSTQQPGTFDDCLSECLEYLQLQTKSHSLLGVVFFIDAPHADAFQDAVRVIASSIEEKALRVPYNVVVQPGIHAVSMELWLDNALQKTEYLTFEGIRYTRIQSEMGTSIWAPGLRHQDINAPLQLQIDDTFRQLSNLLQHEGFSLSDIIRQWNYVPGILDLENDHDKTIQHYQIFNDVRKHWYAKASFKKGYPAATGIGVKTGPYSMDVIATNLCEPVHHEGLSNPRQENAYQYALQHLVGDSFYGQCKQPPLFERAQLLTGQDPSIILISGTAAILGQETEGVGDVRKQTEISIKNMLELTTPAVTGRNESFRFDYLRIYIKHAEHRDTVQSTCDLFFPGVSAIYVLADICWENLLMEIEGEAHSEQHHF